MQILKGYNFSKEEMIKILLLQQLSEFYMCLREEMNYLREYHQLVKNIERIDFYEKNSRGNIETYLSTICECHQFLKECKGFIKEFSEEDFKDFFAFNRFYSQDLARGLYEEIAIKMIEKINNIDKFYITTPYEVNFIIKNILKVKENETCFDFAFGKGGLAIQVANKKVDGIEINSFYRNIGELMLKIANKNGIIKLGDAFNEKVVEFDVVVSNPPFGINVNESDDKEYLKWGNPLKASDSHFISLALSTMKDRGALIMPQGALFRGGAEGKVRKSIIKEGYIEGIISLPANLMDNTAIATSIIIFNKSKRRDKIFMFDVTKEYFKKIRGGVTIEKDALEEIVRIYNNFEEREKVSKLIDVEKILENDGILNAGKYIEITNIEISSEKLKNELEKMWNKAKIYKKETDLILEHLLLK